MFVSIKWKAVAFLSLVLVVITATWVAQQVFKTLEHYENRVADLHLQQERVINRQLEENALRLSQLAQLIAETPRIQAADKSDQQAEMNRFLQSEWFKLNLNTGIDYLAVYSAQGNRLGSAMNLVFFRDPAGLSQAIDQLVQGRDPGTPQSFLYCGFGCSQFVIEPFVLQNGSEAVMVIGQNIADVIQHFQQISTDELAIILDGLDADSTDTGNERSLGNWNKRVWAASNFSNTFRQLKAVEAIAPFGILGSDQAFDHESRRLLFNTLDLTRFKTMGTAPHFVAIIDETRQYNNLVNSVKTSLLIGVLALVIAEVFLVMLILSPLRRLIAVVEALNLLPKHEYEQAQKKIHGHRGYLSDELTLLEKSTRFVTQELDTLHTEVEQKNHSLKNQIAIISRSRAFLERLIDSSHLFIATHTIDGRILTTNTRFEREFSRPLTSFQEIFKSDAVYADYRSKIALLQNGKCDAIQFDAKFTNDQGHTVFADWTCSLVENENGQSVVLATGVDLTQRKRDEQALEWLANHDPLTCIGNRRAFQHDLANALEAGTAGAIVFIDINRFKQINDLYGHAVGDSVLIQIANSLTASVRASDSISRLAGDEFTIILPGIAQAQLQTVLAKLSAQLNGEILIPTEGRTTEYSVSIGAALIPEHGTTEQELVVHADMAMYQAKKKGVNQWQIFDPKNNNLEGLRRDHDLTSLLKRALAEDGLFELHFQPILFLEENRISHHEVLLRLKDSSGAPVFPSEFIPAAERMGLIRLVDTWVLERAIRRLAAENAEGGAMCFAVNVSAPTLQSADLPEILTDLIHKYQINPGQLILELTETAYIENFQMVLSNLEEINATGVMIALDDFGVGFSSFSYLKKLPLSYVKLDGSYILDLEKSPDNQVFVESLTNMVNAFGMQTIAEFVEDEVTLVKLRQLGVDFAQGYHIGKPSPVLMKAPARGY
ncbi:EAL domain-containing protein [Marinobacter sp.]|uniref:bifunctional diguanylate cyclase/phosphodiesterase n=1 Tax=Marinobacter sp. TaxID=50741 RepID=UPI003A9409BE